MSKLIFECYLEYIILTPFWNFSGLVDDLNLIQHQPSFFANEKIHVYLPEGCSVVTTAVRSLDTMMYPSIFSVV